MAFAEAHLSCQRQRVLQPLVCNLASFNTDVLDCRDVLFCSSTCDEPGSALFSLEPLCMLLRYLRHSTVRS